MSNAGCLLSGEPFAHCLVADLWPLFEGEMAGSGDDEQLRIWEHLLELTRGGKPDGAVSVTPDHQHGAVCKAWQSGAQQAHIDVPAANDCEHVIDGAGDG